MAVTIKRRSALQDVGLVAVFKPFNNLPPVTWPHFEPGDRVAVVAPDWSRKATGIRLATGDTGTVRSMCPVDSWEDHSQDLYVIVLDKPESSKDGLAYLTYSCLRRAQ